MKVKELVEQLQQIENQERIVIMSIDGEGNSFSRLSTIELGAFNEDQGYGLEDLDDRLIKMGYTLEDVINGDLAVCLWPE